MFSKTPESMLRFSLVGRLGNHVRAWNLRKTCGGHLYIMSIFIEFQIMREDKKELCDSWELNLVLNNINI